MSEQKVKKHKYYLDILNEMYAKKNSDYGDAFSESLNEFGTTAALVRMSDKFNRLKTLMDDEEKILVKEESIIDTLLDLANYSVMTAMWIENVNSDKVSKAVDGDLDIIELSLSNRLWVGKGEVKTLSSDKIWDIVADKWVDIE